MSSSAIVTTRWTRAAGERREDGDSTDSGWVMSHRGDPEFAPWLLGTEVLRECEFVDGGEGTTDIMRFFLSLSFSPKFLVLYVLFLFLSCYTSLSGLQV